METTQHQIFEETCSTIVKTASGKTFTILGSEKDPNLKDPILKGLTPRVADAFFDHIRKLGKDISVRLWVEYAEIYMGNVFDLLSKQSNVGRKKRLRIRQSLEETYIEGLTRRKVNSREEVIEFLKYGSKKRISRTTEMNKRSSRSHTIFTIRVEQHSKFTEETKTGKFNLVDLAGSESIGKAKTEGVGVSETKTINTSLFALGNVINSLVEKKRHIPFRDSPLTRILEESLGGNSKTSIICNVSPHVFNFRESLGTMRFGERAKKIECKVKANVMKSRAQLMKIIEYLKGQLKREKREKLALLKEIEKLKGRKLTPEELSELVKVNEKLVMLEMKESGKENVEMALGGPEDSFDIAELKLSVREWKLKYEDKVNEVDEMKVSAREDRGRLEEKVKKLKQELESVKKKAKNLERENEKLEVDIITLTTGGGGGGGRTGKDAEKRENELIKLREEKSFALEDLEYLRKKTEQVVEERNEYQTRVQLYEEMGYGNKIKEIMEQNQNEIAALKEEIQRKKDSAKNLLAERDQEIQKLKEICSQKANQAFKFVFENGKVKKDLRKMKKEKKKSEREKKKMEKKFSKEKKKMMAEYEKQMEANKIHFVGIIEGLKKKEEGMREMEKEVGRLREDIQRRNVMQSKSSEEFEGKLVGLAKKYKTDRKGMEIKLKNAEERNRQLLKENQGYFESINAKMMKIREVEEKNRKLMGENKEAKGRARILKAEMKKIEGKLKDHSKVFEKYKSEFNEQVFNELYQKNENFEKEKNELGMENERLKDQLERKEVKLRRLEMDLIKLESEKTKKFGGFKTISKKIGTRIKILNELREMRVKFKHTEGERVKFKRESDVQRVQLRAKMIQMSQFKNSQKKLEEKVKELQKKVSDIVHKNNIVLEEREKKIQKHSLRIEELNEIIEEMEEYDELNKRFEYQGDSMLFQNFDLTNSINTPHGSRTNTPTRSRSPLFKRGRSRSPMFKRTQSFDSASKFGELFKKLSPRRKKIRGSPRKKRLFPREDPRKKPATPPDITVTSTSPKGRGMKKRYSLQVGRKVMIPKLSKDCSISEYITSGRAQKVKEKNEMEKKEENEKKFLNNMKKFPKLKGLLTGGTHSKSFLTPPKVDVTKSLDGTGGKSPKSNGKKKPMFRRSVSFSLQSSKNLDRNKFFAPNKLKDSPWNNLVLRKTKHNLF